MLEWSSLMFWLSRSQSWSTCSEVITFPFWTDIFHKFAIAVQLINKPCMNCSFIVSPCSVKLLHQKSKLVGFWIQQISCKGEGYWENCQIQVSLTLFCQAFFPMVLQLFLVWFCDYDVFVGLFFILPCIDSYQKVDLRTVSFDVPPQEVLTDLGYVKSICRLRSVVALITSKRLSLSSDSDQRQRDCGSRCCCLLQNQWPHYVSHQCGKGWSVNSPASSDNIAKLSGHQKPEWNFSRPWRNQPCHAGMNNDTMNIALKV